MPSRETRVADLSNQARGRWGEDLAAAHYRRLGYEIVDRNWRSTTGELDLVVSIHRTVVFCEVKAKSGSGYGSPAAMVGREKQRRLRRAAEAWLAAHPEVAGLEVGLEVVALTDGRLERIRDPLI